MQFVLRRNFAAFTATLVASCGGFAHAQEELSIDLGLSGERVYNANSNTDESQSIDENQYVGSLSMVGLLQGSLSRLESDLRYEARRYTVQSNQNHGLLIGDIGLYGGNSVSRFVGELTYAGDEQLIDPAVGDAPDNLDLRAITQAQLGLQFRKAISHLLIYGFASNVEYDISKALESEQAGAGIRYTRSPRANFSYGVNGSAYGLDYKDDNRSSFDYTRFGLFVELESKQFEYRVAAGTNSIRSDESDYDSPFYELSTSWTGDSNRWELVLKQWLTDTSQGSRGTADGGAAAVSDGRLNFIDQYKYRDVSFHWTNRALCARCELMVGVGAMREDYREVTAEDNTQRFGSASLSYRLKPQVRVSARGRYSEMAFREKKENDYREQVIGFTLQFLQLTRRGSLNFFAELVDHQFTETSEDYNRKNFGAEFFWNLYRR